MRTVFGSRLPTPGILPSVLPMKDGSARACRMGTLLCYTHTNPMSASPRSLEDTCGAGTDLADGGAGTDTAAADCETQIGIP